VLHLRKTLRRPDRHRRAALSKVSNRECWTVMAAAAKPTVISFPLSGEEALIHDGRMSIWLGVSRWSKKWLRPAVVVVGAISSEASNRNGRTVVRTS
jgi:hypothetical protein